MKWFTFVWFIIVMCSIVKVVPAIPEIVLSNYGIVRSNHTFSITLNFALRALGFSRISSSEGRIGFLLTGRITARVLFMDPFIGRIEKVHALFPEKSLRSGPPASGRI